MSLTNITIKNIGFNFLATLGERGLTTIARLIMFGVLANSDIGLASFAILVLDFATKFRDLGLGQAVIYFDEKIDEMLDTSLFLIAGFSLILCIGAFFSSTLIGNFFNDPLSIPMIKVISIQIFLGSLASVPWLYIYKTLKFKYLMYQRIIGAFLIAVLSISFAYMGFRAWSIVLPLVIVEFFNITFLWLIAGYKPRIRFNPEIAKKMFSYSKYIVLSAIIAFLTVNMDRGFIQKILGSGSLGIFTVGMTLVYQPIIQPYHQIESVMFPTFSMIKDDIEKYRKAYLRAIGLICTLTSFVTGFIFIAVEYFIPIIYESRLYPAISIAKLLSLLFCIRTIASTSSPVFRSKGKPEFISFISGGQGLLVFILLTYFGMGLNLTQICNVLIGIQVLSLIAALYYSFKFANVALFEGIKMVLKPLIAASLSTAISYYLIKMILDKGIFSFRILNTISIFMKNSLKIPALPEAINGLVLSIFIYVIMGFIFNILINKGLFVYTFEKLREYYRQIRIFS
ncbi:MAG: oligosaccharide flippase family protein [Candidatus Coatesbacteria bacterium]|nr:oligosaccharide flippase family protein [Candidatus Coatesbacteria bacterium]